MIFHSLLPLQGRSVSPQETNSVIGGPQFGPQGGRDLNILYTKLLKIYICEFSAS